MNESNIKKAKYWVKMALRDNNDHNLGLYDQVMSSELTKALEYLNKN